jgi:DNA polymerase elongation subunit (family B)
MVYNKEFSYMTEMKILLFDIETSPNLAYVWGKYDQNVIRFEEEWQMLSFAYKWHGEKKTYAYSLADFPLYKKDKNNDRELVAKLHEILSQADVVVGHNSDDFDIRKANARFIAHGLKPPTPFKSVDTKKVAKRYFKFNSNSLSDLGQYLGLGDKLPTGGFDLWLGCMAGNKSSWKKMVAYNKQDVVLLESVYNMFLPWITNHPNVNILNGQHMSCTNCGSKKLQKRGYGITSVSKHQRYQCSSCGKWSKGKHESLKFEVR